MKIPREGAKKEKIFSKHREHTRTSLTSNISDIKFIETLSVFDRLLSDLDSLISLASREFYD